MNYLKGRYGLCVAIGGVLGALGRFYIGELVKEILGKDLGFLATFFINISGCVLIAYILTLTIENIRIITPELRLMTTTGFCGAYTTFSGYGLEVKTFLDRGDVAMGISYGLGSAITGIIGVQIGVLLARIRWCKN